MKTGEGGLFYYLNYFFIQGNQEFLNELPVCLFFAPQRKLQKLDHTLLQWWEVILHLLRKTLYVVVFSFFPWK